METAVLVLSVAFGAFCIWLTVRIVNRQESWAIATAAAIVACFIGLACISSLVCSVEPP
jgi:Kef-type K+ transport system membrane component KefB